MSFRAIIFVVLGILFLIFVFQNIQTVSVQFLVFEMNMPRALLLIITWIVGLLIGIFLPYEFKKSRKKQISSKDK
jgi:uncharacterized integral membrane protein